MLAVVIGGPACQYSECFIRATLFDRRVIVEAMIWCVSLAGHSSGGVTSLVCHAGSLCSADLASQTSMLAKYCVRASWSCGHTAFAVRNE